MKLVLVIVLLAPLLTICKAEDLPVDCNEIRIDKSAHSGVYTIAPNPERSSVRVFCDMHTDGGGWTAFHIRIDGSLNFYRDWDMYKQGFGNPSGEYWLGLENIHELTHNRKSELLVFMADTDGKNLTAWYSSFSVDSECDGYALHVSGFTDGGGGDGLSYRDGQKFSTYDKDQDATKQNCAMAVGHGSWFKNCRRSTVYRGDNNAKLYAVGTEWFQWKGHTHDIKHIVMMVRSYE